MRRTSNAGMRKAAIALVLLSAAPGLAACSRGRPFARHESTPPLAVAAAIPSAALVDAGAASSTLPNKLVPFASARLPSCGRPSGCGPWQISWSADDGEIALLGDDVVTILDAHGLGPKRRIRAAAYALGERCFQAMVPSEGGIDFVDLVTGKTSHHFKPPRPSPDGVEASKLALADDCRHWSTSLPISNAMFDGDHPVIHPFAALQGDDTTARVVANGHFLQWNVIHDGKPMTAFEDARSAEGDRPLTWFGAGSVISPDDALVVDTGGGPDDENEDGYERRRRQLGFARLARTVDGMDVYALDSKIDHAAFCASSQLFVTTEGKRLDLHWQEAAATLSTIDLPFVPTVVSFSNDGSTIIAAGENAATALAIQDCDYKEKCISTAICAKK